MGIVDVSGIEISEYASRYCADHFNIPVIQKPFSDVTIPTTYSIITAWYFIEHSSDPIAVMKKIYDSLSEGGLFAFSVPSIYGPLFRFNRYEWVRTHPSDHSMDFSPAGIRGILKQIGFHSIRISPGGIHPERVMDAGSILFRPFSLVYGLFSRLTAFSDTMEVYAVK